MKVFGIAGWSGSGKTTLLVRLIPELTRRGISVSTVKHTHHKVDIDQPNDPTRLDLEAGAAEAVVVSQKRHALIHWLRGAREPDLDTLISHMGSVDLLLVEGFKTYPHPKLEVHRPAVGKPLLCDQDPYVTAVASDAPLAGLSIPLIDLDNIAAIADFLMSQTGLGK